MALNGELSDVLNNIIHGVAPVIKLSNGLYTLVNKNTIVPDRTPGTNLFGYVIEECDTYDETISFTLIGNWSTDEYWYDRDTNKWVYQSPPEPQ